MTQVMNVNVASGKDKTNESETNKHTRSEQIIINIIISEHDEKKSRPTMINSPAKLCCEEYFAQLRRFSETDKHIREPQGDITWKIVSEQELRTFLTTHSHDMSISQDDATRVIKSLQEIEASR